MNKKFFSFFISLILFLQYIPLTGCSSSGIKIYDNNRKLLVELKDCDVKTNETISDDIKSYIEIVIEETAKIISEIESCEIEKAKELLKNSKYDLYTHFNNDIFNAIKSTYTNDNYKGLDFGCAITNNTGQLLATYSGGNSNINFATAKTPPYSSIKPLSVYTPAIDNNTAYWSKTYIDSAVKKVINNDNNKVPWPANANGRYTNKNTTVHEAIIKSFNTISIKCLQDYGIEKSINFLKDTFNFPITPEEAIYNQYGEEEILGNLGMGYMREGVSPVNMAGYYQIFATKGKYFEPTTIYEIKDCNGETIYKRNISENQVIKETTASIMNQLLQDVVSVRGTGKDAMIEGLQIGGKTGTGEKGNWFVGFCPEYTCAVWHGTQLNENNSSAIFSNIIKKIANKKISSFSIVDNINKSIYCCESGCLANSNCKEIEVGYFNAEFMPDKCELH